MDGIDSWHENKWTGIENKWTDIENKWTNFENKWTDMLLAGGAIGAAGTPREPRQLRVPQILAGRIVGQQHVCALYTVISTTKKMDGVNS